jgi:hypothetical protein
LSPGKQNEAEVPDEQIDQQDKDWLHDLQGHLRRMMFAI